MRTSCSRSPTIRTTARWGSRWPAGPRVSRVACAVSASLELFERAEAAGADLLLVHHGLFWDNESRVIDDRLRRKLEVLFRAGITLAAYHLALDAHAEIGNNVLLARELDVEVEGRFAGLGVGGTLPRPLATDELAQVVAERLGQEPLIFPGGSNPVRRIAIISGGAARYAADAAREGYDAFLTGEASEPSLHLARELGITFVAAGHYATERLGVQALAERLGERFDLPWEFIELPNPV